MSAHPRFFTLLTMITALVSVHCADDVGESAALGDTSPEADSDSDTGSATDSASEPDTGTDSDTGEDSDPCPIDQDGNICDERVDGDVDLCAPLNCDGGPWFSYAPSLIRFTNCDADVCTISSVRMMTYDDNGHLSRAQNYNGPSAEPSNLISEQEYMSPPA
jgi:hypothetical protein